MKKLSLLLIISLIFTSCGLGAYSISSGQGNYALISFVDDTTYDIIVKIDNKEYQTKTIKTKKYKPGINIKQTTQNALNISTGKHKIEVFIDNNIIYSHTIYISTNEHKIIEL